MKKNTYYIPVKTSNTNYIKVEAISETKAVEQVEAIIHNHNLRQRNDEVAVLREHIECEQDDEMIEAIKKDFNVEEHSFTYETDSMIDNDYPEGTTVEVEGISHEIFVDGSGLPKSFTEETCK